MELFELVLRNMASGHVSKIERGYSPFDQWFLARIAREWNVAQGREHKNVKWTIRPVAR